MGNSDGIEAISQPPVGDGEAKQEVNSVFDGEKEMIRRKNPEVPGGSIALVTINQIPVQEPPHTLARMHAAREKQVVFNK
jgi:hypothetical protein